PGVPSTTGSYRIAPRGGGGTAGRTGGPGGILVKGGMVLRLGISRVPDDLDGVLDGAVLLVGAGPSRRILAPGRPGRVRGEIPLGSRCLGRRGAEFVRLLVVLGCVDAPLPSARRLGHDGLAPALRAGGGLVAERVERVVNPHPLAEGV